MYLTKTKTKLLIAGWIALIAFITISIFSSFKKEESTAEQMNGYNFSWEIDHGDVCTQTNAWVFLDTKTAIVEQKDISGSRYLQDEVQKYAINLTDEQLFLILDVYQAKTESKETTNTPYDQAVINALNIIKNGEPEEATKELKLILNTP